MIQNCEICGSEYNAPWNEGACDICRVLINATPEDRARYLAMMKAAAEAAHGAATPVEAYIEALRRAPGKC